jgi:hypothetical protein
MLEEVKRFPELPSFHIKSQVLEIHKHEKHFNVPHNKESQGGSFSKDLF